MRSGHVEAAELLIKRGADVNKEAVLGLPLTVAVLKNSADLMRLLLAHGADPNAAARGETMLHFAVESGCLNCVKVLVEAGADVNAVWIRGDPARLPGIITPYHLARNEDHADIAAYLSTFTTLEPGDLVLTGTPGGVGAARDPKVILKPGQVLRPVIEGVGECVNTVDEDQP